MLGIEPGSSGRAATALKYWVISLRALPDFHAVCSDGSKASLVFSCIHSKETRRRQNSARESSGAQKWHTHIQGAPQASLPLSYAYLSFSCGFYKRNWVQQGRLEGALFMTSLNTKGLEDSFLLKACLQKTVVIQNPLRQEIWTWRTYFTATSLCKYRLICSSQ